MSTTEEECGETDFIQEELQKQEEKTLNFFKALVKIRELTGSYEDIVRRIIHKEPFSYIFLKDMLHSVEKNERKLALFLLLFYFSEEFDFDYLVKISTEIKEEEIEKKLKMCS